MKDAVCGDTDEVTKEDDLAEVGGSRQYEVFTNQHPQFRYGSDSGR
jgi:hypothetical protein